jgi:hypothetical protein
MFTIKLCKKSSFLSISVVFKSIKFMSAQRKMYKMYSRKVTKLFYLLHLETRDFCYNHKNFIYLIYNSIDKQQILMQNSHDYASTLLSHETECRIAPHIGKKVSQVLGTFPSFIRKAMSSRVNLKVVAREEDDRKKESAWGDNGWGKRSRSLNLIDIQNIVTQAFTKEEDE